MQFFLRIRVTENKFKEFISKFQKNDIGPNLNGLYHLASDPFTILCICKSETLEKLDEELDSLREYAEIEEISEVINTERAKEEIAEFL